MLKVNAIVYIFFIVGVPALFPLISTTVGTQIHKNIQ